MRFLKNLFFVPGLVLFGALPLAAQQVGISGRVLADGSNLAVEYAAITILTKDSVVLTGGLSDSAGNYSIEGIGVKDPLIKVSSIGYKSYSFRPVLTKGMNLLPPVLLAPEAKKFNEVTVEATKQNSSLHLDKQVINAAQFQNAANGTGLDVLKNLSSVTVNTEGQVKLRGSDGFIVLINGKPSNRSAEDILSQMPANEIENIEVISSGSAMYDADGKAGIINIITKKSNKAGWSLSANTQFGGVDPPQAAGDLTVNYNAKRGSFYIAADYRRFDYNGYRIGTVRTLYQDTLTYLPSDGIRDFRTYQYSFRAGGSYDFGRGNNLELGAYFGGKQSDRQANLHYRDYYKTGIASPNLFDNNWAGPQDLYYNQNNFIRQGTFFTTNLTYIHDFSNKSKLSLLGQYEYSVLGGPIDNQNLTEGSLQLLNHEYNYEHSPLNSFRAQADYSASLKKDIKLDAGLQFRYLDQKGDFAYLRENLLTSQMYNDPAFSDTLDMRQDIEAAYMQVNGSAGIFSYNIGLRGEYMQRTLVQNLDSVPAKLNEFDLFPTVQGLLKLKHDQKLKLSYNRRIDRPTLKLIAPFKIQEHAETVEFGDPNAKPEISDVADLSYSKGWKIFNLTAGIYYTHVQNKIFRVNSIYTRTELLRLFTNAGNTNAYGFELTAGLKATHWLQFYLSGNIYEYSILGYYYSEGLNSQSLNYNINGNTTIDITKHLKFQFDVSYVSRTATEQGWDDHLLLANASLKYSLLNNTLDFGLKLQNVFNTNSQTIATQTPVFYSATDYIKFDRLLLFSMGYRFNASDKNSKAGNLKTDVGEKDF